MTSKENISDYESQEEFLVHNEPNYSHETILLSSLYGQVLQFILYIFSYILLACTFYCIYFFYLLPSCGNRTSPSPVFMTISMTVSNNHLQKTTNSFCSHPQNPSAVHSLASNELSLISRGVPGSVRNPQVRMIYYKEPKTTKPNQRVLVKEPAFQPSCLPALAMPRPTKKGRIRSSTRENFEKRDLCGGNTSDQNMVKYHAQVVVTSMTYAFYYQCGMRVPHVVFFTLSNALPTLRDIAIEAVQTLPPDVK